MEARLSFSISFRVFSFKCFLFNEFDFEGKRDEDDVELNEEEYDMFGSWDDDEEENVEEVVESTEFVGFKVLRLFEMSLLSFSFPVIKFFWVLGSM